MPFFSIIIPTYNRASLLKDLLQSFTSQSFTDFEVIIVDDGGTDNSEDITLGFSDNRFRYFKKNNGGVSSARNFGLTKATGMYINFFDSDDIAYPNHLSEAYHFFTSHPESPVVIFDYDWGDSSRVNYKRISNTYKNPNLVIRYKNFISTNCIFIKKNLTDVIKFNERLNVGEDWEYWLRLSSRAEFSIVNVSTSYINEHPERGLKNINLDSLIVQKTYLIDSLREDASVMAMPDFNLNSIASHFCSLIALNAALVGKKKIAARYFWQSLVLFLPGITSRRSLAILKHLLFK